MRFVPGTASDLMTPPFLGFDLTSSDGGTGHVHIIFHKQPELERSIRDAIILSPCSELRCNTLLTSITEDDNSVTAEYTNQSGSIKRIRAPFLVGADGKTGYVRKRYLEPKGVLMERCEGYVPRIQTTQISRYEADEGQNKLRRNLGSAQLADASSNAGVKSRFPSMGPWLYARASLRLILPARLSLLMQSLPALSLWKIWSTRRQTLEVRICRSER
jgi:hypothetical protein